MGTICLLFGYGWIAQNEDKKKRKRSGYEQIVHIPHYTELSNNPEV